MPKNDLTPLYVDLPAFVAGKVQDNLNLLMPLPPISLNQLIKDLRTFGQQSRYFTPFRNSIALVEGACEVTYNDANGGCSKPAPEAIDDAGNMTIGIGLNVKGIDQSAALQSLFYAIDSQRSWQFPLMAINIDQPNPALTSAQVDQLFLLTLIGTDLYNGILNDINDHFPTGLADAVFPANQLVAIVMLGFNNADALIGSNLCEGLVELEKNPNDPYALTKTLIEMVEHSDVLAGKPNAGLLNRDVIQACIFMGATSKAHASYRAVWDVLANDDYPNRPLNGANTHALSILDYEKSFVGGADVFTLDGTDKLKLNTAKFAAASGSTIEMAADGSKVWIGGKSADTLRLTAGAGNGGYHFMAGNGGINSYVVTDTKTYQKLMIYDVNRQGKVTLPSGTIQGIAQFQPSQKIYTQGSHYIQLAPNPSNRPQSVFGYPTPTSYTANFGEDPSMLPITIGPDYLAGQFGVGFTNGQKPMTIKPMAKGVVTPLSNGNFLSAYQAGGGTSSHFVLQLTDQDNQPVASYTSPDMPGLGVSIAVVAGPDGQCCINFALNNEPGGASDLYTQTFDAQLRPTSAVIPHPIPSNLQAECSTVGVWNGKAYVFAEIVSKSTGSGNFYPSCGNPEVGVGTFSLGPTGQVASGFQLVIQTAANYLIGLQARLDGGALLSLSPAGGQNTMLIMDGDNNVFDKVALPGPLLYSTFTDTQNGFFGVVKANGVYQLAIYQGGNLKLLPVPDKRFAQSATALMMISINDQFVLVMAAVTLGTVGIIVDSQTGQIVMDNINLGTGLEPGYLARLSNAGILVGTWKGILNVQRFFQNFEMPAFFLQAGQEVVATDEENPEAAQCELTATVLNCRLLDGKAQMQVSSSAFQSLPTQQQSAPRLALASAEEDNYRQCHQEQNTFYCQGEHHRMSVSVNPLDHLQGQMILGMMAGCGIRRIVWGLQNWYQGRGFNTQEPPLSPEKVKSRLMALQQQAEELEEAVAEFLEMLAADKIEDDANIFATVENALATVEALINRSQEVPLVGSEVRAAEEKLTSAIRQWTHTQFFPFDKTPPSKSEAHAIPSLQRVWGVGYQAASCPQVFEQLPAPQGRVMLQ